MAVSRLTPRLTASALQSMGRRLRKPQTPFQLRTRPWQIAPMCIFPVLPGETLKSGLMQARVITDPIKNRMIGWWNEYQFYYVKHRDLLERDEFQEMVLNLDWSSASVTSTTDVVEHYFNPGSVGKIDWVGKCLQRVVEEYYRDEGEAWDDFKIGNLPAARITGQTWLDSLMPYADLEFPDVEVDGADGSTPDDTITVGEIDAARAQYEFLRQNFAVDMTYEDFLATYGVRPQRELSHKPELLRFMRDWQYPVSAINPTDGSAASAVAWNVSERIDKDRFFSEPGFVVGYTICRPKVYLSRQNITATTLLDDAFSWLPAVLNNDLKTSLKLVPDVEGPLGDVTSADGYWVDIRDLFLYGEQFVNFALTETDAGMVALPTAGLQKRYASATDADALFAAASPANQIRQDGIITLNIAGRQVDQTPST